MAQVWLVDSEGRVLERTPVVLPSNLATPASPTAPAAGVDAEAVAGVSLGGAADLGLSQIVTRVDWLPGSDTWLMVTTTMAAHIYDLSRR